LIHLYKRIRLKLIVESEGHSLAEMDESEENMDEANGEEYDSYDSGADTDEELKEAFAAGLLKPGMNYIGEAIEKPAPKNNIPAMKQKLADMQSKLPWIERLDLLNAPAPLAPELAYKEDQHSKERSNQLKGVGISLEKDVVHNDFKREMLFYRQAQAAVLEGLPRLQSMNVMTKRPEDYFAQMAKSDDHMNKIRAKLLSKEQGQERAEKIKKLRELKKYGKKVQLEVQQKRQKEKKDMLDEMKKIRKGQGGNMEFLEKGGGKGKVGGGRVEAKRNAKDKKFGFGGKKRDVKKNDRKSTDDVTSFRPGQKTRPGGNKPHGGKRRPGKDSRKKMKNKNKKR